MSLQIVSGATRIRMLSILYRSEPCVASDPKLLSYVPVKNLPYIYLEEEVEEEMEEEMEEEVKEEQEAREDTTPEWRRRLEMWL